MAKKKKSKFELKRIFNRKNIFISLGVVLLVAANVAFTVIYIEYRNARDNDPYKLSALLISAIEDLNSPMPEDVTEDKQYLPELKLAFPFSTDTKLIYRAEYSGKDGIDYEATDQTPPYSIVTSEDILNYGLSEVRSQTTFDNLFRVLPGAQACQRAFVVFNAEDLRALKDWGMLTSYGDDNNQDKPHVRAGSFKTADGRTMLVYREQDLCVTDDNDELEEAQALILRGNSY